MYHVSRFNSESGHKRDRFVIFVFASHVTYAWRITKTSPKILFHLIQYCKFNDITKLHFLINFFTLYLHRAIWHSLMGCVGVVIFGCFDDLRVMCETTNEHTRCSTNKPKTSDAFAHARLIAFVMKQRVVVREYKTFTVKKQLAYFGIHVVVKGR